MGIGGSPPWFDKGLRFRCTACGECCKRPGFVSLTPLEGHRIAKRILGDDATAQSLMGRLWELDPDGTLRIDVGDNAPCPLLGDDDQCTVHDIKPMQCATYPFWPEIVGNEASWLLEQQFCEGVAQGDSYTIPEIQDLLRECGRTRAEGGPEKG